MGISVWWGDEVHLSKVFWVAAAAEGELVYYQNSTLQASKQKYTLEALNNIKISRWFTLGRVFFFSVKTKRKTRLLKESLLTTVNMFFII